MGRNADPVKNKVATVCYKFIVDEMQLIGDTIFE
jgi:hypothetical protein